MSSLRVDKATGPDGISARLLKEACPEIVPSLTHIINLSIRCGYFPDEWKISKVLPLYKEDIKSDPNNYRPISILPFVSKIIEKTKYMITGSHCRLRHLNSDLNVTVNSQQFTRVTNYRYLGIEVDEAFEGGNRK